MYVVVTVKRKEEQPVSDRPTDRTANRPTEQLLKIGLHRASFVAAVVEHCYGWLIFFSPLRALCLTSNREKLVSYSWSPYLRTFEWPLQSWKVVFCSLCKHYNSHAGYTWCGCACWTIVEMFCFATQFQVYFNGTIYFIGRFLAKMHLSGPSYTTNC